MLRCAVLRYIVLCCALHVSVGFFVVFYFAYLCGAVLGFAVSALYLNSSTIPVL